MKLYHSLLIFSFLHSIGLASGCEEIRVDGELYRAIPKPTPEPLLSSDEHKRGTVLMETRLGYQRSGTSRRNFALGARQLSCSNSSYVLSCPLTKKMPCCPAEHPICCTDPRSTLCCSIGTFCNGITTCCNDGQVPCSYPEGCCPGGTICCGILCCPKGFECRNDGCIKVTQNSLPSVASVESLESARSKSSESAASTEATYSNSSGNAALVGGAVGGVLGALALVLAGVVLCRRNRGAPLTGQRPLLSQQPSSQPITPASLTFQTNSNYIGGHPATNASQPGYHPQQLAPFTLSGGVTDAGQTSLASQQFTSTQLDVNPWTQRVPDIQQDIYGGLAFGSLPAEDSADPRVSHGNTLQGSTHSAAAMTFPYSASEAFGGASSPPPRYSTAPPVSEPPVSEKTGSLRP